MREFKGYTRGVNLGGWLSQCDHTEKRYSEFVTEKDIENIKSWGVDHVRVPVDYELVEEADGTVTAISTIAADGIAVPAEGWYTLNGVKLQAAPTAKGVYINNGKKVVIK